MKMVDGMPRRIRLDLNVPLERAVRRAHDAVEAAGAHPLLTEASSLIDQAREKVADWIETVGEVVIVIPDGAPGGVCQKHHDALMAMIPAPSENR